MPIVTYGKQLSYSEYASTNKLYINSNKLLIDQTKQQAHFSGNVILWFDDIMIKTTSLEIFYKVVNNKKVINYILIPERLTAKRNNGKDLLIATSAKYFVENKKLILFGNVIVQNKDGIIRSNKLVFYI